MFRYAALVALVVAVRGADVELTVPAVGSVSFQSPNYPENYPDNSLRTWKIKGPEGASLEFTAKSFELESSCSFDYLEVVDGGVSLGKWCGTDGPAGARTVSNEVTVTFKSDSSVSRKGFDVSVKVARCKFGETTCPNHEDVCMDPKAWCDGKNDCPDGADEQCPDLSQCGKTTVQPNLAFRGHKIVGGVEAAAHSWPWQVALMTSSNFQYCGGSVIAPNWVMTAAHCCAGKAASATFVRVGAHNLNDANEGSVTHAVEKVFSHAKYTSRPATNWDFCLLKTKEAIRYHRQVAAVCLPEAADAGEAAGSQAYISGWGTTSSGGSASKKLLQTSVTISNQTFCNTAYGGVIADQMICAAEPGHDTCQGDSGGPLVTFDAGTQSWRLIGVTSWGRGCALATHPGVYGRVSVALDWILQTMFSNQ